MKIAKIIKNNTVWITSDHHFGHNNICKFKNQYNEPLRPWDDVFDMEEELIKRWNERVNPNHYVIHCGDFAMNKTGYDRVITRLNGKKILLLGNHDTFDNATYLKHFVQVLSMITLHSQAILTHIPLHPTSLDNNTINIHGHLHSYSVLDNDKIDPRYMCVCVEQTDFYPVLLNDVIQQAKLKVYHRGVDNVHDL